LEYLHADSWAALKLIDPNLDHFPCAQPAKTWRGWIAKHGFAYADAMLSVVKAWVPQTYAAFADYRLGAVTFSAQMLAILKRMLGGEEVAQAESGLSKREWAEMMIALGRT
jgi:hypothetical protein